MGAKEYHHQFTNKKRFSIRDIAVEFFELIQALSKLDKHKIKDELSDVAVCIRLYIYCNFDYNSTFGTLTIPNLEKEK